MSKRTQIGVAALVLLLTAIPYIVAGLQSNNQVVFGGFVFNPMDGNSYLAKMYQGWSGSWRFVLPYTSQPGSGAYLFLFYLFLGHLARLVSIPLIWVYHIVRCLSVGFLVITLAEFLQKVFPERPSLAKYALLLAAFGSGSGWIGLFFGVQSSDLWVSEAYPFLSSFANPHFPLGIALLLWIFKLLLDPPTRGKNISLFFLGLFLAIIMPFGLVVAAVVALAKTGWDWVETRQLEPAGTIALLIGGGPYLLYQFWVILIDPVLAGWNAQNLTASPELGDLMLSLTPAIILAFIMLRPAWSMRRQPEIRLLLTWFVLGFVLIYVPFSLQRRFIAAYYVPVAVMAVLGMDMIWRTLKNARWLSPALLAFSVLTNLLLLGIGLYGGISRDPAIFYTRGEEKAMQWISQHTKSDDIILAGENMGLLIPAHTGRRVIFGHDFETIQAEKQKKFIQNFFDGTWNRQQDDDFLKTRSISYVFYGPREQQLGHPAVLDQLEAVYQDSGVTIYRARSSQ